MRQIEAIILTPFADAVLSGELTFIICKNEGGYQKGDVLIFHVMESDFSDNVSHPLNGRKYEITYVLSGHGIKSEYVALGIKPKEN